MSSDDRLVTIQEAVHLLDPLGISRRSVYRLAADGLLGPVHRLDGLRAVRVERAAVEAYLRQQLQKRPS